MTVTGRAASSTNPRTWSTFGAAHASTVGDGLGYVLCGDDRILCVDIDHCLYDGNLAPWAAAILDTLPAATYIEVSPGDGLHIWGTGSIARGRVLTVDGGGRVEVYSDRRYMTITGQRFAGAPSELAPLGDFIAALTA